MIDIDKETGTLRLHQSFVKKIDPTTELKELQKALPSWEQTDWQDGRSCLMLKMQNPQKDETLHLLLYYFKLKLSSIELYFTGISLGDDRCQWSKAREFKRKKYHESLFSSVLGKYQWGSVQSVLNTKEGYSCIRLEYSGSST
jgi:hypothetical protein